MRISEEKITLLLLEEHIVYIVIMIFPTLLINPHYYKTKPFIIAQGKRERGRLHSFINRHREVTKVIISYNDETFYHAATTSTNSLV